jgi:ABC-2 type transporter
MNAQMSLFASFANASQFQVFSACTLLGMMLFGGFIIAPNTIPAYYIWLYWWNPFAWAYRALVVNEFRSKRWDEIGGDAILKDAGFTDPGGIAFGQSWVGYSYAYMLPYLLICCCLSALGLQFSARTTRVTSPDPVAKTNDSDVERRKPKKEIPFQPVTLSFHSICYDVQTSTSNEKLRLLDNVNGVFRPGRMCALMVCIAQS